MDLSGLTPSQLKVLQQQLGNVNPYSAAVGQGALDVAAGLGTLTGKYNTAVDPFVRGGQDLLMKYAPSRLGGISPTAARIAGSGAFRGALRAAPALGAVAGVMGAADVIAGQDSLANKAMDATAMGIGGFLGSVGGPMGIAAGAGVGKTASDSLQWLFGDKKTADQRKMEEALALLKAGVI